MLSNEQQKLIDENIALKALVAKLESDNSTKNITLKYLEEKLILLPIKKFASQTECVGVLGFYPKDKNKILSVGEREILFTLYSQLAIYLERENYHESVLNNKKDRDL
jgi:hypothetical protein